MKATKAMKVIQGMKNVKFTEKAKDAKGTKGAEDIEREKKRRDRAPFHSLARCYDVLNYNADYKKIADFAEDTFAFYNTKPELVLDLACGTGSLTIELDRRGYDMIGLDGSHDMLSAASAKKRRRKKSAEGGGNGGILWTNQDMTDFELYGTVDAVICSLDSVNYILESEALEKCFKLVYNYLNFGGVFIFDVNSRYKFENIYDRHDFVLKSKNAFGAWESYYNRKTKLCSFEITLFTEESPERYVRSSEFQRERYHSTNFLTGVLRNCGFRDINIFSDFDINSVICTGDKNNKIDDKKIKADKICFSCIKK